MQLQSAAFLLQPSNQSLLLGLDSFNLDLVHSIDSSRRLPTRESLKYLSELGIHSGLAASVKAGAGFKAISLLFCCNSVDRLGLSDAIGLQQSDKIALLSPASGLFQPIEPAAMIGKTDDGWTNPDFSKPFKTSEVHLARMHGAVLIGRGLLLNSKSEAIVDVQNDSIRRNFPVKNLHNVKSAWMKKANLQLGADKESFKYSSELSDSVDVVERACYLLDNGQGYNFANWHMYVFPRLFPYFDSGLNKNDVKLVIYKDTSSRLIDMLKGFGFKEENFFVQDPKRISIFTDLYVPSALSDVEKLLVPQAFRVFDRLSVASLRESGYNAEPRWALGHVPRKVYLSRADVPRRRLINENRIEDIARQYGYEVLFPADLSLIDVINLYRNVDVICGPSGSSFLNMLLMKEGSRSIMISHPRYSPTAYLCCQFGGLRNINVDIVFGHVEAGESVVGQQEAFSVDEDRTAALIKAA